MGFEALGSQGSCHVSRGCSFGYLDKEGIFAHLSPLNMSQVVKGVTYLMSLVIIQESILDIHWVLPNRVLNFRFSLLLYLYFKVVYIETEGGS